MWPAWQVGRLRPDLRANALADAARLTELPRVIAVGLLPGLAIIVPLIVSALHATTASNFQPPYDPLAIVIAEVFTESLVFMAVVLAIGVAAPAAGALTVGVFALGDFAATFVKGELDPWPWALVGRLASYVLLWTLAVEIPLMGRAVAEWRIRRAGAGGRWGAVLLGAAVVVALAFAWVQAAPLLIGVVFRLTAGWGSPTIAAIYPLQLDGVYLVGAAAVSGLVLLGIRYASSRPWLASAFLDRPASVPGGPVVAYLVTVALTLLVLSGVITQPIDFFILLPALLLGPAVGRWVSRSTPIGSWLARVPLPVRLIMGFVIAVGVAWVVISILGIQPISGFFSMVVALAISYVIISVFIATGRPQPAVGAGTGSSSAAGGVVTTLTLAIGLFVFLALPAIVLADNGGDHADGWPAAAAAALAAAGAAALAAMPGRLWDAWMSNMANSWRQFGNFSQWAWGGGWPDEPDPDFQPHTGDEDRD
jgi:hypothetical protein